MYLHEFQAKKLLSFYGISVPNGFLLECTEDITHLLYFFDDDYLVLKAQVHLGGRGKLGGIIIVENTYKSILHGVKSLLNKNFFLKNDFSSSLIVSKILVESKIEIISEFYFSYFINRDTSSIVLLVSKFGGIDVEISSEFFEINLDLNIGLLESDVIYLLEKISLDFKYLKDMYFVLNNAFSLFVDFNLLLLEINPFVLTNNGFLCLDAKIEVDDASLFRNRYIENIFDYSQKNKLEVMASKKNMSYIALNGLIGCIVNGAGLAMATLDVITIYGGKPANFLDIGGNAASDCIISAFEILLLNPQVKVIFINIFGGIIRCDIIAKNIVLAVTSLKVDIPVIVRLIGNMSDVGLEIINNSRLNLCIDNDLLSAVKKSILYSRG